MSESDSKYDLLTTRLLQRLNGFILGIGIDEIKARDIVRRAIADMPEAVEEDIEAKARAWMLIALA